MSLVAVPCPGSACRRRRVARGDAAIGPIAGALVALALACGPVAAHAFGDRGHRLIGAVADALLTPAAAREVERQLHMPLRDAATWADCARPRRGGGPAPGNRPRAACAPFETRAGVVAMADYVRRNARRCGATACADAYHYTDVALASDRYRRAPARSGGADVVAAIGAAIDVLQGRRAPFPFDIRDRREALLLLAHFVGDVHQPLHVGSLHLDRDGRPIDPRTVSRRAARRSATQGGHAIELGGIDLHTVWDRIPDGLDRRAARADLLRAARSVAPSPGRPGRWPAAWATESLGLARVAYRDLRFEAATDGRWIARPVDAVSYRDTKDAIQADQVARAGARLAQVLNAIWR